MFPARPALTMALLSGFVVMAVSALPALADFNHKFPGKGSYAAWWQSGNIQDQAFAAEDRGDYKAAEALYRKVIQTYPYDAPAYFNLGLFLNHQKRYKEAEPYLRKSIELQPVFQNWDELGVSLATLGQLSDAEYAFSQARRLISTNEQRDGLKQHEARLKQLVQKRAK